ncbi:MAG TPA: VWA domain-containing protein, partial [Stellaceae bacterium]|nr:VWA domain-containing protein [Stellaceae bacterium]
MAHLRLNGFTVGPAETEAALRVLAMMETPDAAAAKLGLKTMLSGNRGQWERFDALFDAYWLGRGVKTAARGHAKSRARDDRARPRIWDQVLPPEDSAEAGGPIARAPADGDDAEGRVGTGRLVASRRDAIARADLRTLVTAEEKLEAERIAEQLANAIRYRLSRRRVASRRGAAIDLRRTIHRNLSHGGEPLEILRKRRPERPVNLVLLLDVSGSMKIYSRYFISFVRGLLGLWLSADAFVFHTRLIHISDALREKDTLRAMDRLSLMVEGFGGGTQIASALKTFNDRYAREVLNSRSVVIVMSDGYDTDPPEALVPE